jgi:hypothetical protein
MDSLTASECGEEKGEEDERIDHVKNEEELQRSKEIKCPTCTETKKR